MKKLIILDIICYVALPYFIWNYGRESLGDYYAILLSTVPGFIYTIFRFAKERQFNIAGLFVLSSLFIGTIVNILSENGEKMLWNQIYLGYGFVAVYLLSILIKKPLALYFAVDFVYLQGFPREDSRKLFTEKEIFKWYQLLTGVIVIRGIVQNTLKAWLINSYGIEGYGKMLIYMQISGWIFGGLIIVGYFFIGSKVNLYIKENNIVFSQYKPDAQACIEDIPGNHSK